MPTRLCLALGALLLVAVPNLALPHPARADVVDGASFTEGSMPDAPVGSITAMAWAPDGSHRLFVTAKEGTVRILKYGPPASWVGAAFATISPIHDAGECGLLGLAFDPNFQVNHYVYFFVTVSSSEQQIIRYTANGDVGTDKTVIVNNLPTKGGNHNGGGLGFGPDGKLYWGIGDNYDFSGVDSDLLSLASKIGRANADGTVPNDNPFYDGAGPNADYIWGRGLRNPFTLTFNPENGALWVNVVGTGYEQVFLMGRGDHAGYNDYENTQPPGSYLQPIIKYLTNGSDNRTLTAGGAVRNGGVVAFTTTGTHGFRRGEMLTISGVGNASFNGTVFVASTSSATTFSALQSGANESSGGGSAATANLGGCITGGTFYAGTQFASEYRGDFFFGDYNSGRIMRAHLQSPSVVERVETWATGHSGYIDIDTGPDGALYYVTHNGALFRTVFNASAQGLVVSRTHLWMAEGGQQSFSVSLAQAPGGNVSVNAARASGDADITVSAGGTLTFTTGNWNVPQAVTVASAVDGDMATDVATLEVSSSALATQTVTVNAVEADGNALVVSTSSLAVTEGGSGTFTVALAAAPAADVTVTVARGAGDSDVTVSGGGSLTFTAGNFSTAQTVTIAAAEDADNADDSATITISGGGFASRNVTVTGNDNDEAAPVITSTANTTGVLNAPYAYTVTATGRPTPTFSLSASPASMTINASSGAIAWTPSASGTFPVTVVASNGVVPNAAQSFSIVVGADLPPTCMLTKPDVDGVVSGTNAEFFGDGDDDVGTTKAEFFVDGVLGYTDVGTSGHYHWESGHTQWDTTAYGDGSHQVKIKVTDTIGQSCEVEIAVTVANAGDAGVPDAGTDDEDAGTGGTGGSQSSGGSSGASGRGGSGATSGAPDASPPGSSAGRGGSSGPSGRAGSMALGGDAGIETTHSLQGGCTCRVGAAPVRGTFASAWVLALALTLATRRRKRRGASVGSR
jgi:glucose/arabinose dehydrogenase